MKLENVEKAGNLASTRGQLVSALSLLDNPGVGAKAEIRIKGGVITLERSEDGTGGGTQQAGDFNLVLDEQMLPLLRQWLNNLGQRVDEKLAILGVELI